MTSLMMQAAITHRSSVCQVSSLYSYSFPPLSCCALWEEVTVHTTRAGVGRGSPWRGQCLWKLFGSLCMEAYRHHFDAFVGVLKSQGAL